MARYNVRFEITSDAGDNQVSVSNGIAIFDHIPIEEDIRNLGIAPKDKIVKVEFSYYKMEDDM